MKVQQKSKSGRKAVADKKRAITIYLRGSIIDAIGADAVRALATETIETKYTQLTNDNL
jgi:hypothetical protein